ncbi:MAG: ROK family protein, partial [Anaerolineae bacterium]|nr:ROK family protein [Anaerolineae bacterium]
LGLPGKVDPERGIGILSVNLGWRDVPVKSMLEEELGLPCFIENDVKVAALGESRYGAGKGLRNMVYLTIGTGIAAGVIIEGKIYRGSTGMAGEIGHAIIERNGPRCKCGTRGCLEAVAAGPAIAALAISAIEAGSETSLRDMAKANKGLVTAEMVCQAARQGNPVAREIFEEIGSYIGLGVHMLIMLYDPELVVLGGGVTGAGDLLLNPVRRELKRLATWSYVAKEMLKPEMVRLTPLGTDVGILGAAALAEGEMAVSRL